MNNKPVTPLDVSVILVHEPQAVDDRVVKLLDILMAREMDAETRREKNREDRRRRKIVDIIGTIIVTNGLMERLSQSKAEIHEIEETPTTPSVRLCPTELITPLRLLGEKGYPLHYVASVGDADVLPCDRYEALLSDWPEDRFKKAVIKNARSKAMCLEKLLDGEESLGATTATPESAHSESKKKRSRKKLAFTLDVRKNISQKLKDFRKKIRKLSKVDGTQAATVAAESLLGDYEVVEAFETTWISKLQPTSNLEPVIATNLAKAAAELLAFRTHLDDAQIADLAAELRTIRGLVPVPLAKEAQSLIEYLDNETKS